MFFFISVSFALHCVERKAEHTHTHKRGWYLRACLSAHTQEPRLTRATNPPPKKQIIGAPAFFTTVWSWIKRWFDPVTVSKIFVLSAAETLPTLRSFIALENIPKQYGGGLDFAWNDPPKLDAAVVDAVAWAPGYAGAFPPGPLYWVPADEGRRLECVASGTVGGKERREVVGSIAVAVEEEEEVETSPAVVNGDDGVEHAAAANGVEVVASPETEKFVDAPEEPLTSPVSGMQDLSLEKEQTNEKTVEVAEPAVPNGKPVAAA